MKRQDLLVERLKKYRKSEIYRFHMPGHKRQMEGFLGDFPNPFSIDLTEIDGFDNLHHAEGILRESMDWAANVYGADKSYYLVNGSSGGILSAICGSVRSKGRMIMARNCHKSTYHGVILKNMEVSYVYPQILEKLWINGGISAKNVEESLKRFPDTQAVFLVSPTYEGIVSDVASIASVVHEGKIPLIVDEAHGAHFSIGEDFPVSALKCGADIVIQSLHKTLPSFTQTAILHVKSKFVDVERLEWYLQVFQSSSPSYVLMAGMEECIFEMEKHGNEYFEKFTQRLERLRKSLSGMKVLKLLDESVVGTSGVYGLDQSKIVISCHETEIGGAKLGDWLREKYGLEVEMCGIDYVVMITTILDTQEGLCRLGNALLEIDKEIADNRLQRKWRMGEGITKKMKWNEGEEKEGGMKQTGYKRNPEAKLTLAEAFEAKWERVPVVACAGRISCEFIYLYPPGVPIIVPGERMDDEIIRQICEYKEKGLLVQGMEDKRAEVIKVCAEKGNTGDTKERN